MLTYKQKEEYIKVVQYESPKPARLCSESEEKPSAIFLAEKSARDWKPRYKRFYKTVF